MLPGFFKSITGLCTVLTVEGGTEDFVDHEAPVEFASKRVKDLRLIGMALPAGVVGNVKDEGLSVRSFGGRHRDEQCALVILRRHR